MSDTRTLRHNQSAVQALIENADKLFGAGGPGMHEMPPYDRKARGQSRPALTPAAMKYIENAENKRTAKVVTPYIEALREVPRNYYLGYDLYILVCLCGWNTHDHGYLRNLKAPEDDEGRRELAAWDFVTMLIATKATKQLESQGRNPKLKIVVSPKDQTLEDKAEERKKAPSYTVFHAYELIAKGVAEIEGTGYSREEAILLKAENMACSLSRVKEAVAYVDRKREEAS